MRVGSFCGARRAFAATLCTLAVLAGAESFAGTLVGVGSDPPPPMGPFVGNDDLEDMIMVGDPSNPVPIVVVTEGPAWMKEFVINRDGQGWATDGPRSMVSVMEFITFVPDPTGLPPVLPRDWHEDIDPTVGDGHLFKWAGGVIEILGLVPPIAVPGMVSADGKSIWFDFPPLPPGTTIKITKQLMYAGTGPITPGPTGENNYRIKVNERPSVPEPGTLVLAGLAMAGAALFARRCQRC